MDIEQFRVKPGVKTKLNQIEPNDISAFDKLDKESSKEVQRKMDEKLEALQELLYAQGKHKILIVLQAMDCGGKDGVIRRVFRGFNPAGIRVVSFKVPTPDELGHDYLWRVHKQTPGKGEIVIFNRSHYEDVLVVRVHNLVPAEQWSRRYEHIKAFEKMLTDEGTTILKFFLHISRNEQKKRLEDRRIDPTEQWKFNVGDLGEREHWTAYMRAYEDAVSRTSTERAPWFVIPANNKWYRNLVISQILIESLEKLDLKYPDPPPDLDKIVIV